MGNIALAHPPRWDQESGTAREASALLPEFLIAPHVASRLLPKPDISLPAKPFAPDCNREQFDFRALLRDLAVELGEGIVGKATGGCGLRRRIRGALLLGAVR